MLCVAVQASDGVYEDQSGPEMARLVAAMPSMTQGSCAPWPCAVQVVATGLVPDDPGGWTVEPISAYCFLPYNVLCCAAGADKIRDVILGWLDAVPAVTDVILTSGGTGFGPRDHTPEAVRAILHREAPGVAQALIAEGLRHTPLAVLSRPVVGTRGSVLIATLPGSVKAVRENMVALQPLLPRIVQLLRSGTC